jgi:hypothetical protein
MPFPNDNCTDINHESVTLHVQDLLPDTPDADVLHRGTFPLPLKHYVELLEEARGELAVKRYLGNRPQRPVADMMDGDYQPDD